MLLINDLSGKVLRKITFLHIHLSLREALKLNNYKDNLKHFNTYYGLFAITLQYVVLINAKIKLCAICVNIYFKPVSIS